MTTFFLSIRFVAQTTLMTITVSCLTFSPVRAQPFKDMLTSSFTRFDSATEIPAMTAAASHLEMIAVKNPDKWASYFYSAYAHIKLSYKLGDKDRRDQYLDEADASLTKADKLSPNNEEIFILQAYSAKARIAASPKERWKKYGDIYSDLISKAKKIKAENPRIYFMEGMDPFWRPKIWGGGKNKAKPYFQKAKELFSKEDRSDILKPYWGQQANEEFLKQCDQ